MCVIIDQDDHDDGDGVNLDRQVVVKKWSLAGWSSASAIHCARSRLLLDEDAALRNTLSNPTSRKNIE
jgi:hypothetical protein